MPECACHHVDKAWTYYGIEEPGGAWEPNPDCPVHFPQPKRIQLSRKKGWRKPEGAIVVARNTQWGNPWKIGGTGWTIMPGGWVNREPHEPLTREQAIESFRNSVEADPNEIAHIRKVLAGHDLACWCPLDQPCHADVLLEIAN